MKLKFIWKLCLIFGISSFLFFLKSCEKRGFVSYLVYLEWVYINETKYSISYLPEVDRLRQFNVAPLDTTIYIVHCTGPKDVQIYNLVPPIMPAAVVIDGVRVDSLLARRLWDIRSYEYLHFAFNSFKLYFRFTYENIAPAQQNESN